MKPCYIYSLPFIVTTIYISLTDAQSTCGKHPSSVKDCDKVDYGSCGNACCLVDASFKGVSATHIYQTLVGYLQKGGDDGSYGYNTGPDNADHNPSDSLLPYNISWAYIFQGHHKTTGGYVDTLNFNIAQTSSDIVTLRLFSISNIHGALGDSGQNYKSLAYLLEGREVKIVHGCGKGVIPPTLPDASLLSPILKPSWPRWLKHLVGLNQTKFSNMSYALAHYQ
eukprot:UC4_evm2s669